MTTEQLWAMLVLHGAEVYMWGGSTNSATIRMPDGRGMRIMEDQNRWGVPRHPLENILYKSDVETLQRHRPEWYFAMDELRMKHLLGLP